MKAVVTCYAPEHIGFQFIQLGYLLGHLFSVQFILKEFFLLTLLCSVFWAVRIIIFFSIIVTTYITDFQFSPGCDALRNAFEFSSKCRVTRD